MRTPRPTDRIKLKAWTQKHWPKEPQRQKSEFDAGMAAINAAQKDQVAQATEADRRAANVRAARGKK